MSSVTDEELFSLYTTRDGDSPGEKTLTSKTKQGSGASSLFKDLAANPIQKQADFNFVSPSYSPIAMPLLRRKQLSGTSLEGTKRKKIKIVSTVGKFSNYESRKRLISQKKNEEEELTAFPSTSEFWQWVKLSLSRENYSKYIRAIKKFKGNQNTGDLAEEVKVCFTAQFIPQCLQGISHTSTPHIRII